MNLISERELQATIIEAFEASGQQVFHVGDSRKEVRDRTGFALVGDAQTAGYPDLTIAGNGGVIWAELKRQHGRLEAGQVEWLDALPEHKAYVWQPKDLDLALQVAVSGHPEDGRTCWTCRREEIPGRIGMKKRKGKAGPTRRDRR